MDYRVLLEEYFAAHPDIIKRDKTRTTAVIDILIEQQIERPTENDYETKVIPEIMKKYPRVKSKDTAGGYITCARKFFTWVSKKGDKTMDIPLGIETKSEGKSVMSGVTEPSTDKLTENEDTEDIDMAKSKNTSNIGAMTGSKDILNIEGSTDGKDTQKKTGKNGKEQISIYVDSDIYAEFKEFAKYKKESISDILSTAMRNIVEKNREKLQRIRQAIESENLEI